MKVSIFEVFKRRKTIDGPYILSVRKDDGTFLDAWGNEHDKINIFAVDVYPKPDIVVTVFEMDDKTFNIDLNLNKEVRAYTTPTTYKIKTSIDALFFGIQQAMKDEHVKWFFASKRARQPAKIVPSVKGFLKPKKGDKGYSVSKTVLNKEEERAKGNIEVLAKEFFISEEALSAIVKNISFRIRAIKIEGRKVTFGVYIHNLQVEVLTRTVPSAVIAAFRREIGR